MRPRQSCFSSSHVPVCLLTHHTQKAFRFLALPAEIRDIIYREALVPRTPKGIKEPVCTLAHPPLARVSKQLRAESLPVFYGENQFFINIDALHTQQVFLKDRRREVDAAYQRYVATFEAFSAWGSGAPGTSCIRHIKDISVIYRQYLDWDQAPSIGFLMGARHPGALCSELPGRVRICQGIEDWGDFAAVRTALLDEMDAWVSDGDTLSQLFPRGRIAAMLWFCAKECPLAARHVELWYDELSDFRRDGSET